MLEGCGGAWPSPPQGPAPPQLTHTTHTHSAHIQEVPTEAPAPVKPPACHASGMRDIPQRKVSWNDGKKYNCVKTSDTHV